MTQSLALVVDDEPDIRELLELTLSRMEIKSHSAEDVEQAKSLLKKHHFDLCLTDLKLPDGNGIELVEYIQQRYQDTPVAVITAHGNMESAITALKAGAFDFVSKPVDLQMLRNLVTTALKLSRKETPAAKSALTLLGDSPAMQATRATIARLARSQAPVYISGESGTGKELVARLIHEQGPRADKPFIPVNCGAIPEDLMESEFFGHKKGSFTGAVMDKKGLFQAANGGTLFLDEVADLPVHMQVKLLRAIQEKAVRAIGEQKEIPIDVRILSATHKDLMPLVKEGRFRQDLYYRINVIELHVPSLRERPEDIPLLAAHILIRLARLNGTRTPALTDNALKALLQYPFPGNVRELENILERAMTLCDDHYIHAGDLQLSQAQSITTPAAPGTEVPLEPLLGNIEKEAIIKALEQARHNKTAAARLLGISFGALRYRLKKLGLG
ncbi:MAG TPA: sigma-54 dependent transcriptional regulator [Gammaproteobacteria bacterium]